MKELLMGNEAIAAGALMAGVQVVAGYPGTPSTEVLETVAKRRTDGVYVEWSVNEKAALEVAAGAALSGARAMVTMKQVGLNVASDPLMSLNYIGVKGALVVFAADDPGPISSQTEQDTRRFAKFAKIAVFDPSSPEEAYELIQYAFDFSHRHQKPVIFRATTRVCHSCASIDVGDFPVNTKPEGFISDPKWVIFPRLSYQSKLSLEKNEPLISDEFSKLTYNSAEGSGSLGIICGGISCSYVKEALNYLDVNVKILKIATPYPFPFAKAEEFLRSTQRVIVFEELDSVIEDELIYLKGKKTIDTEILGKRTETVPNAGELSANIATEIISKVFGAKSSIEISDFSDMPSVPNRPPVLCAGCPHRASFYAVKQAMKGKKAVFCGDIGCYTLGNAAPLDMVDTCLCMGAGINMAQGIEHAENGSVNFAFVGDSTFFASGITGVINAVYNQTDMVLVVLDNSTTAMTGHQPHPGTGRTMMGEVSQKISIPAILKAIGLASVVEVNPLELDRAVTAVKEASEMKGVRAIIFKSPCIALEHSNEYCVIDTKKCSGCKKCINQLGCPAISLADGKAYIEPGLCTGCGLCSYVCPSKCISRK